MKRRSLKILLILIGSLGFLSSYANIQKIDAFVGGVNNSIFWVPPKNIDKTCDPTNKDFTSCIISYMQKQGASNQAIAFRKYADGYPLDMSNFGNISLIYADIIDPKNKDQTEPNYYLITGLGYMLNLSDSYLIKEFDMTDTQQYKNIKAKYPKAEFSTQGVKFLKEGMMKDGHQYFEFSYPIADGSSKDAKTVAEAKIGFKFSQAGVFVEARLLGLKSVS